MRTNFITCECVLLLFDLIFFVPQVQCEMLQLLESAQIKFTWFVHIQFIRNTFPLTMKYLNK